LTLLSVVFPIRPQQLAVLPADQGRALAAEFLRWVQARDPSLSVDLHRENELRPYTISGLRGGAPRNGQMTLSPEHPLWWRITTLTPPLSQFVLERVLSSLPESMTLGDQTFDLLPPILDPRQHPWAGRTTWDKLAAGALIEARHPPLQIEVQFASPTTFRSQERHQPFPLPGIVFRQWLEKWNAFSPVTFPKETLAFVENRLVISRYRLESQVVRFGEALFIGFVGRCTYRILEDDPYWRRVLHALARYAFFCGTGAKTSFGLGQTRSQKGEFPLFDQTGNC